ncbi:MAG: hypothetical protein ACRDYC_13065 [Acidimicrobiales bacterium]
MIRSGDLWHSIQARDAKPLSAGIWEARTYPTVIYARIQELGGNVYAKHMTPKGLPGFLRWFGPDGEPIFRRHVYIPSRPYLRPGLDDAKIPYWTFARDTIAEAITG